MESRFNMFDNEIGARFSKRFASASLVIAQSPLPKSMRELARSEEHTSELQSQR